MFTQDYRQESHDRINHIFKDLFPARGMTERPAQIELSHRMLDAMIYGQIALCDAGTGIGKTFAYLVAGTVFLRYRAELGQSVQPIVISTSSIALQRSVCGEYLPTLSGILQADGLIASPLRAVIRKGKSHYVCDERLERRLRQVDLQKKNSRSSDALLSLRSFIDLDEAAHLSGYDRERVCVPQVCDCHRATCRYREFLEESSGTEFQICNHNLLLADAIHRSLGRRPILPSYPALVIDEAHKLPEAARQMLGVTLCAEDFEAVARALRAERFLLASEDLIASSRLVREMLRKPLDEDARIESFLRLLVGPERCLQIIRQHLHATLTPSSRNQLAALSTSVTLFCAEDPDIIYYATTDDRERTSLCATVADLSRQLGSTLWSQPQGIILTSATLAVGDSFRRYREETGLTTGRVVEAVSPSPFDYERNCLLYLPEEPPRVRRRSYHDETAREIASVLNAAHGHGLVLFTSYAAMSAVKGRLKDMTGFPLFTMGRNAVHTAERFKRTPGAVLLATGPAWEGFDFPGDCVSLLVIPRLPFPYPDALKERERANYATLQEFIRAVIVPEMQIKLRQGFGRAIRTETDTCVIAVLDERAAPGGRYHAATLEALPTMPVTRSLADVEKFIRSMKPEGYFGEGAT